MMSKEKRKHSRIPIKLDVSLIFPDGYVLHGSTENISFGGAFVSCKKMVDSAKQENCTLKLFLNPDIDAITIKTNCRLVRSNEMGIGVQFAFIDVNDCQHLKKLMIFNTPNSIKLMNELEKNPAVENC